MLARVDALVKANVDVIVVDSAHGHSENILRAVREIKAAYPELQVIAGNVATGAATKAVSYTHLNPCPCGYYPDMNKCRCTPGEVSHYLHKLSQPLLERIDLCADVPPVNFSQISGEKSGESSALIRKRVEKARRIQQKRYQNEKICFNGELSGKQIRKYCVLTENACLLYTSRCV